MYLYLNINNIIIDIVEDCKPVMKNSNGYVVGCYVDKAQGYMGTNEQIYAKIGVNFIPSFTDIKEFVNVEEVPSYVVPRVFKYENGEFVEAESYELSGSELTNSSLQQRADIDYIAMETGVDI